VLPVLLPLTALLFASTALGGEIEDRTLLNLTLKPISRLQIVLAKLMAAALVTVVLVDASLLLMYVIAVQGWGDAHDLAVLLLSGAAGSLVYASVFLVVGLFIPRRVIIAGIIYVLSWEGAAAGLSSALATLTVRRYVQGAFHAGLQSSSLSNVQPVDIGGTASILILCAIIAAAIGVCTWQLGRMELP
jgi:ABC-type transport system involved in multi-copper enzyme maturation permease subunit